MFLQVKGLNDMKIQIKRLINPKAMSCDPEIFRKGEPLFCADTGSCGAKRFEEYIVHIRQMTGCKIDWHYSGGRAQVLFIGSGIDRKHLMDRILGAECPARILCWFGPGDAGLHRNFKGE